METQLLPEANHFQNSTNSSIHSTQPTTRRDPASQPARDEARHIVLSMKYTHAHTQVGFIGVSVCVCVCQHFPKMFRMFGSSERDQCTSNTTTRLV